MQETHWVVSLIVSWLPFIVLVIVWVLLSRSIRMRSRSPSGATLPELTEQYVAETRRMNVILERIAVALEKRAQG